MSGSTSAARSTIAVVIAGLTVSLLTGCFGNPLENLVNQGVEDAVEGVTGGEVSVEGELPADFPESVPLIDGDIGLAAGTGSSEGWMVVVTSSAADPLADATAALEEAGFVEDTTVSGAGLGAVVYSNDELLVLVAGNGTTVTYTVTPKP